MSISYFGMTQSNTAKLQDLYIYLNISPDDYGITIDPKTAKFIVYRKADALRLAEYSCELDNLTMEFKWFALYDNIATSPPLDDMDDEEKETIELQNQVKKFRRAFKDIKKWLT